MKVVHLPAREHRGHQLMAQWFYLQSSCKAEKISGLLSWRDRVRQFCDVADIDQSPSCALLLEWQQIQDSLEGEEKYQALDQWRLRAWDLLSTAM